LEEIKKPPGVAPAARESARVVRAATGVENRILKSVSECGRVGGRCFAKQDHAL
jgi:hypothetical protein